ncbi:MAG: ATP-binding protein [Sphingobacteriaceae bacterium]|nr:ATP-binding protein [Sphingobacteriaceae bacterium]
MENISKQQQELSTQINNMMRNKGINQAVVSRIARCSTGTVSDLLGGKKQFSNRLLNIIGERIKVYASTDGDKELIKELRQFKIINSVTAECHKQAVFGLLVGNTGLGKSIALQYYTKKNKNTYYIKIDRKLTWNQLLNLIAMEFGLMTAKGKKREVKRYQTNKLMDMITSFIESQEQIPCLIIDESEGLSLAVLKNFKNLYTATQDLLSIVICGITDVRNKIAKIAGLDHEWLPKEDESNVYTTFARRLKRFTIPNISMDDMQVFCGKFGIVDAKIIALATKMWWNYDEAAFRIRLAQSMGINLSTLTTEEFELINA